MNDVDKLLRDAQHASWLGMDAKAAGLYRRLAIIHQQRATERRLSGIQANASGIEFEELGDTTIHDIPAFLRRQAD